MFYIKIIQAVDPVNGQIYYSEGSDNLEERVLGGSIIIG